MTFAMSRLSSGLRLLSLVRTGSSFLTCPHALYAYVSEGLFFKTVGQGVWPLWTVRV